VLSLRGTRSGNKEKRSHFLFIPCRTLAVTEEITRKSKAKEEGSVEFAHDIFFLVQKHISTSSKVEVHGTGA
jgi:hypothetical protein